MTARMTVSETNAATAIFSPWESLLAAAMDGNSLRLDRERTAHSIRRFVDTMAHRTGNVGPGSRIVAAGRCRAGERIEIAD